MKTLAEQVKEFMDWRSQIDGKEFTPALMAAEVAKFQEELAPEKRCTRQNIEGLLLKNLQTPRYVVALARAMGVTAEMLKGGRYVGGGSNSEEFNSASGAKKPRIEGSPVIATHAEDGISDGYIQIRESSVRFAAGNGRAAQFEEIEDSVPATYRREWFDKEGINPALARRFKVHGDSMEPFLFNSDSVLVNLAETSIQNGKVYALRYSDELRIKRVYRKLDGGLILHSDNPDFLPRDEDIAPGVVQEHISIIGRVRDKSGTGGL